MFKAANLQISYCVSDSVKFVNYPLLYYYFIYSNIIRPTLLKSGVLLSKPLLWEKIPKLSV
jgi:hypothetical protein